MTVRLGRSAFIRLGRSLPSLPSGRYCGVACHDHRNTGLQHKRATSISRLAHIRCIHAERGQQMFVTREDLMAFYKHHNIDKTEAQVDNILHGPTYANQHDWLCEDLQKKYGSAPRLTRNEEIEEDASENRCKYDTKRNPLADPEADPFSALGIPHNASKEETKIAFRALAKIYHPDTNASQSAAEDFKQIQSAYEILQDDKARWRFKAAGPGTHRGARVHEDLRRQRSEASNRGFEGAEEAFQQQYAAGQRNMEYMMQNKEALFAAHQEAFSKADEYNDSINRERMRTEGISDEEGAAQTVPREVKTREYGPPFGYKEEVETHTRKDTSTGFVPVTTWHFCITTPEGDVEELVEERWQAKTGFVVGAGIRRSTTFDTLSPTTRLALLLHAPEPVAELRRREATEIWGEEAVMALETPKYENIPRAQVDRAYKAPTKDSGVGGLFGQIGKIFKS